MFGVGLRDDPYITFWEAEQLAKTGELVNINGAHIEQSSSLAHVVILAALYLATRAPLPVLAYVAGLVGLFAVVVLSAWIARQVAPSAEIPAALFVAVSFPVVYWAVGGLETDIAAAGVLWFVRSLHDVAVRPTPTRWAWARFTVSTILIVTVRPDTMITAFVVALGLGVSAAVGAALGHRAPRWLPAADRSRAIRACAVVAVAILALTAFREVVFHAVLPQPELAKAGGLSWVTVGFSYVFTSLPTWMWIGILLLGIGGTAWCVRCGSAWGFLLAVTFVTGVVIVMFTRGDWMGGARLLVPYLPCALVLMAVGAGSLRAPGRAAAVASVLVAECITLVMFANGVPWLSSQYAGQVATQASSGPADVGSPLGATWTSTGGAARHLPWYTSWDYVSTRDTVFLAAATPIVRRLVEAEPAGVKLTVASNQAGLVFYTWANDFPGRIEFIDTEGIATTDFSRCSGLQDSYAGQLMTIVHWAATARRCAPPLPDVYFSLNPPAATPGLTRYFDVVADVAIAYRRHGVGTTVPIYDSEYLAERIGWHP